MYISLKFSLPTTAIITVVVWNVSPCNMVSQISETLIFLTYNVLIIVTKF